MTAATATPESASRGRAVEWIVLAIASLTFVVLGLDQSVDYDLTAFACAGTALGHGLDPYLATSVAGCDVALRHNRVVEPGPLPPYALAPFGALMRGGFALTSLAWHVLIITACAVVVVTLLRGSRLSPVVVVAPLLAPLVYSSLVSGQVVPVALAAATLAAALVRGGRDRLAALAIVPAAIEPHLGLAAALGLAVLAPRARLPLAVAAAALLALSAASGDMGLSIAYLRVVLPAHAVSEFGHQGQFGLSPLLASLGVDARTALTLGGLSTAIALLAGVTIGQRLAVRTGDRAFAIVTPLAFVLVGGTYLHVAQMTAAVPLALALLRRPESAHAARGGLLALAVPWSDPTTFAPLAALCGAVLAWLGWRLREKPLFAVALGAVAVAALVAANARVDALHLPSVALFRPHVRPGELAEAPWQEWVRFRFAFDPPLYAALKLPTWLGLGAVVVAALRLALRPAPHSSVRPGEFSPAEGVRLAAGPRP